MTFSFFLPPANAVTGRATMSAASTSRGERITVLDATFAEEQLRSGSFTGIHQSLDSPKTVFLVCLVLSSYPLAPFLNIPLPEHPLT
jgi:hypothetical protein